MSIKVLILNTQYDLLQLKKFHISERPFSKFSYIRTKKDINHRIKKNSFTKTVLYIFWQSKTTWSIAIFKNYVRTLGSYAGVRKFVLQDFLATLQAAMLAELKLIGFAVIRQSNIREPAGVDGTDEGADGIDCSWWVLVLVVLMV